VYKGVGPRPQRPTRPVWALPVCSVVFVPGCQHLRSSVVACHDGITTCIGRMFGCLPCCCCRRRMKQSAWFTTLSLLLESP